MYLCGVKLVKTNKTERLWKCLVSELPLVENPS